MTPWRNYGNAICVECQRRLAEVRGGRCGVCNARRQEVLDATHRALKHRYPSDGARSVSTTPAGPGERLNQNKADK